MFSTGCRYAVEFDSEEEFKWHVIASIREQIFLSLAIPEYDSILMGNFDLVHILYTKKDKPQDFKKIESIARAHDLFILD